MEIEFDDKRVKKFFKDFDLMVSQKGFEITKMIKKRYEQLKAAETFYYISFNETGKSPFIVWQ